MTVHIHLELAPIFSMQKSWLMAAVTLSSLIDQLIPLQMGSSYCPDRRCSPHSWRPYRRVQRICVQLRTSQQRRSLPTAQRILQPFRPTMAACSGLLQLLIITRPRGCLAHSDSLRHLRLFALRRRCGTKRTHIRPRGGRFRRPSGHIRQRTAQLESGGNVMGRPASPPHIPHCLRKWRKGVLSWRGEE